MRLYLKFDGENRKEVWWFSPESLEEYMMGEWIMGKLKMLTEKQCTE